MPGSGERAYVYAKACGIIGKSFIGKRISALGSITRLSELDRMVFPQSPRDLPERELLLDLERRIIGRAADQITAIIGAFSHPPEFLIRLLRGYEYRDLEAVLNAAAAGEKAPAVTNLDRFRTVHFEAFPDLAGMLKGTEFEWLIGEVEQRRDKKLLQGRLDLQYYTSLWESMYSLAPADRESAEKILSQEISFRNAAWVLRMRTYYAMPPGEIKERLVFINSSALKRSLAEDALELLELDLNSWNECRSWRLVHMLNPGQSGEPWSADPRYFQNNAAQYLYRLARIHFRRRPLSLDTVFCFIKLKQLEEDLLTHAAEGLGLGMAGRDIFSVLEVRP
ncbi:MAG: V-type ATPase subunit [Treponema sp.]|jgi:vacuolar-type H+-ATPase subunit C/Vma6|nr:V-type ATPase subunit [Treponema sp.]